MGIKALEIAHPTGYFSKTLEKEVEDTFLKAADVTKLAEVGNSGKVGVKIILIRLRNHVKIEKTERIKDKYKTIRVGSGKHVFTFKWAK